MLRAALLALCLLVAHSGLAQEYPNRVVKIVNPYAAGGPSEAVARVLAEGLEAHLHQPVIVESRPGAGTMIGADYVAKAPADGYTLLLASAASLIVSPAIQPSVPYDAHKDLAPVAMFATVPNLVVVHPSVPAKSIAELIDYARAHPGKLNYASAGVGTGPHLAGELFKRMAHVDLVHVPFKGAAPAIPELLAGRVQVSFLNLPPQLAHVRAGKLRALGIASARRSALLPEVPTVQESGLPGFIIESWNGIAAPAATPAAVLDTLSRAVGEVMSEAPVKERLQKMGADATPMGREEFAAYVKADETRLAPILRTLELKPH
ncbi:MAG TPA: tripartite tricarboxylate transporter substrate binding protein [Burkholderiales bacterium]|nr:tripartite tricarboxylate transporter substrate binding protein [Burkholderiales bacterium]